MKNFEVLFDHGEASALLDPSYAPYGKLGFPAAGRERPWIYSNFVQTLDGVVSLLGEEASGAAIAQSGEDRWLMDLLRAHADAVLLGMGTLREETAAGRPRPRGPVFRIVDPALAALRKKLCKGRERNIFVTRSGDFRLSDYAVFDGEMLEPWIVTCARGAEKLRPQAEASGVVKLVVSGEDEVDLPQAMRSLRAEHGVEHLLCEGGPQLYAAMLGAGLIDESFVTVSPFIAGPTSAGGAARPSVIGAGGYQKDAMPRWRWLSCRKVGEHQFHRHRRER